MEPLIFRFNILPFPYLKYLQARGAIRVNRLYTLPFSLTKALCLDYLSGNWEYCYD